MTPFVAGPGGPYRSAPRRAETVRARPRLDPGGLALLSAIFAAGATPVTAAVAQGAPIAGQAGVGFTIALGALGPFLRQLRAALRPRRA